MKIASNTLIVLVVIFLNYFQASAQEKKEYVNENETSGLQKLHQEEDGLHFFVIGDWGKMATFIKKR